MTAAGPAPVDLAPAAVSALFVALVLLMWGLVVVGVRRAGRVAAAAGGRPASLRPALVTGGALAGWLALTGALAAGGAFSDFRALPPRLALVLLLALAAIVALARSAALTPLLAVTPASWVISAQAFRIVVELVLWQLVRAGAAPEIMTFTGRNFDVVVGVTAPVVAYACSRSRGWARPVAIGWNLAGILVLANTVIHAQLAAPTRFQVFMTQPPNTFIAAVPYVWLPAFLVPLAWSLHVLSLRQLWRPAEAPERARRR